MLIPIALFLLIKNLSSTFIYADKSEEKTPVDIWACGEDQGLGMGRECQGNCYKFSLIMFY